MASKILIKRSTTSGSVPTTSDLDTGELGLNTADKRVYTNNAGTIVELGTYPSSLNVTGNTDLDGTLNVDGASTLASGTVTGNWTVTGTLTVSTPTNSTDAASKGYVDTAVANVIDAAPGALDTLNELAAAINDDANFATTITNSIATKLALAGGTMTGDITLGANKITSTATPATDDTLTRKGYVDSILGSATDAATSAAAAATSATNAANSATSASGSATTATTQATAAASSASAASTSATNAASSATSSANSATAAATSATNAASSETAAASSESAAATSETNAATSASSASTSASTATTKASEAATSATNAATSATNAATSESAAATSATNASNSASAASTSASNAATSATAASNAQTAAESARDSALAAYDNFDDRYLGAKASDPSVDNDGNALVAGALYFNTSSEVMKLYTGSAWVAAYVSAEGLVQSSGDTMTGDLSFGDNDKAIFGAGSDLQIFVDEYDNSHIRDVGAGNFYIRGSSLILEDADGNDYIYCADNGTGGTVTLKHNASNKLATTSTGIDVTGTVAADGLTVDNSTSTPVFINRDQAIDGFGIILNQANTTDGNGLEISYQATTTGTVTPNTPFAGIGFTADTHNWSTRLGSIQLKTAKGGVGYKARMNVAGNGDISFYEDTGTTPKFFWDASAESLGIGTTGTSNEKLRLKQSTDSSIGGLGVESSDGYGAFIGREAGSTGALTLRNNGSDTLSIKSGQVGIGTSSPATKLAVSGSIAGTAGLNISGSGWGVQPYVANSLVIDNNSGQSRFFATGADASTDGSFLFYTSQTDGGANERMRIDSSGNVGIGTSSPSIGGGRTYDVALTIDGGTSSGIEDTGALELGGSTNVNDRIVGSLAYFNRDNSGVDANTRRQVALIEGRCVTSDSNAGDDSGGALSFLVKAEAGTISEAMRIDSSGNVGIGTSSPITSLTLGTGTTGVSFKSGSTSFNSGKIAVVKPYEVGSGNGHLIFETYEGGSGGGERMRIDSSGNLLVGKTSQGQSNQGFEVLSTGQTQITNDGGKPLVLNRLNSDGEIAAFRKDGTTVGSIGSYSGLTIINSGTSNRGLLFGDSAIRPQTTNGTNLDNTLDLGTSNSRFQDLYLSGGVYLGGTGSANYLDDYETGTWTPTLSAGDTGTLSDAAGYYIKVGNLVFITCVANKSGGSANSINGLPFAVFDYGFNNNASAVNVRAADSKVTTDASNPYSLSVQVASTNGADNTGNFGFSLCYYTLA